MTGLPAWENREEWSLAPTGFVPLHEALVRVGTALFPAEWTGREFFTTDLLPERPSRGTIRVPGPTPAAADVTILEAARQTSIPPERKFDRLALNRQKTVLTFVRRALASGELDAVRDGADGQTISLASAWWRSDAGWRSLVMGWAYPLPRHWLFVCEASLRTLLGTITSPPKVQKHHLSAERIRSAVIAVGKPSPTAVAKKIVLEVEGQQAAEDIKRVNSVKSLMAGMGVDGAHLQHVLKGLSGNPR